MGHKNYKWNISKEKGSKMAYNLIETILKERTDYMIDIDELTFILNNRTKTTKLTNNNKSKNMTNYIKVVFGGILNFIDDYDDLSLQIGEKGSQIKLTIIETNDWIFVDDDYE